MIKANEESSKKSYNEEYFKEQPGKITTVKNQHRTKPY